MKIHFIQHVLFEHPGYLLTWAKQHAHSVTITYIYEATTLPAMDDFDLLIIMGGPMGAYEEGKYEWVAISRQSLDQKMIRTCQLWGECAVFVSAVLPSGPKSVNKLINSGSLATTARSLSESC